MQTAFRFDLYHMTRFIFIRSMKSNPLERGVTIMKMDLYEVVTQKIVERLEAGVVPWQVPWRTSGGMPSNLITKHSYRGINLWMLLCLKYESPFYLTFNQAKSLNGNVRKGEKSVPVIFWKILNIEEKDGTIKKTPLLKFYNVFNIGQIEGIDSSKIPATEAFDHDFNSIAAADRIIYEFKDCPKIEWGKDHAYYAPAVDTVCMPNQRTFFHDEQCYSTLFHELVHSTGHRSRLGRHEKIKDHKFGSQDYSQEELVAELGAAYLCGISNIEQETIGNNAAYIKSWIRTFKNDPKVLIIAAAQAQKAVNYILNDNSSVDPIPDAKELILEPFGA